MRSHTDIIKARGAARLYADLEAMGLGITASGVQAWANRNSIPPAYWPHIVALGMATLEELAHSAAANAGVDLSNLESIVPLSHAAPQHDTGIPATASGQPAGELADTGEGRV